MNIAKIKQTNCNYILIAKKSIKIAKQTKLSNYLNGFELQKNTKITERN